MEDKLYKIKMNLCEELEEYAGKKQMTMGDLETVDKLAHAVKNLCKIIEMSEDEDGQSEASNRSNRGGSMASYEGGSNRSYRSGVEPGRETSTRRRRDSMGRYSSHGDPAEMIREMMEDAPDEQSRRKLEQIMRLVEQG